MRNAHAYIASGKILRLVVCLSAQLYFYQPAYCTSPLLLTPGDQLVAGAEDTLKSWARTAPDDTNTVNILLKITAGMFRTRPVAEAGPYLDQAIEICKLLSKGATGAKEYIIKKKLSRALIMRAVVYGYGYRGQTQKERALLMEALKVLEEIKSPLGIANVYNNLAASYSGEGKFPESLSYHLKALRIREEFKDSAGLAQTYGGLCDVYFRTKKYELAIKYGKHALEIKKAQKDFYAVAERLSDLGAIFYETFEPDSALLCYRQALKLADSIGYPFVKANVLNNIGILYDALTAPDSAIHYHRQALEIETEMGDGLNRSSTVTNLGVAYFSKGEYKKARDILLSNVDSVKRYSQGELLEKLYNIVILCDSAMGDFKAAFTHARLHKEVADQNVKDRNEGLLEELRLQYDNQKMLVEHTRLKDETRIKTLEINRTRFFMAALVIIFLLVGVAFVLLYRQNKQKAAWRSIELKQRLLRSQMNPHFIFNALQAIQNFMKGRNEKETAKYLDSFASLTRDVLENSKVEVIPLEKELDLLRNYLELQKLRFGDRFSYRISVAKEVYPNSVLIPPMLSQPFIENAIEHGLSEKESGGLIEISFSTDGKNLIMEITDNGVGLQNAGESKNKYASRAIEITKERIDLFNRQNKEKSSFEIGEAYPAEVAEKGVKVRFVIPLQAPK